MITIGNPTLKEDVETVTISASIETEGEFYNLWYSFPLAFKEFLVVERTDAFVIGILFLALKTGQDIKIRGALSAKLYYSLQHYLIDALCLSNSKFQRIKIYPDKLDTTNYNLRNCAGTGLSCGVDSFATFYDHEEEEEPFKINYFTFFNAGSHGDNGGEGARKIYNQRLEEVKRFAETVDREIINVDSNISEVLKMNFLQTNTLRNISCVLHLQKLFCNYYIASKNRFDYFKLHAFNNQDYDTLTISLFSTESTTFYSAVSHLTRVERTSLISNYEAPRKYLDVCTDPDSATLKNCSRCDKCLRTALTLDLLGKLDLFEEVFDLRTYQKNKTRYIGKVIATRKGDHFNEEIYGLMIDQNVLSLNDYFNSVKYKITARKVRVKKNLKSKFRI